MPQQKGAVLNSTAYDATVDAIKQLQDMNLNSRNHCVIWEINSRDFRSATYTIERFDASLGESTMHIVGSRGGKYEIIPKVNDTVWIRYKHPSSPQVSWEEQLIRLSVLTSKFEYVEQEGFRAFLSDAFNILETIYERDQ